jgi:hypothetical protein
LRHHPPVFNPAYVPPASVDAAACVSIVDERPPVFAFAAATFFASIADGEYGSGIGGGGAGVGGAGAGGGDAAENIFL